MKNTLINFTDAHGVTHTTAVFELTHGYKNISHIETIGASTSSNDSITVNYQFKFWHSQEAKTAGLQPEAFMDKAGQQTFGVYPATAEEVELLEDYCINHLITTILPGVDPNAVIVV